MNGVQETEICSFLGHHSYFRKDFQMLLAVKEGEIYVIYNTTKTKSKAHGHDVHLNIQLTGPTGSMVEHPLRDREVWVRIPAAPYQRR